jgi:phosphocarrier protein HPr
MAIKKEVTVINERGLHARPAQEFVAKAGTFKAEIKVIKDDGKEGNAKSILSVMSLGLVKGMTITLQAEGEDQEEAIKVLSELVESGLGDTK